jgi:hypothetical protein
MNRETKIQLLPFEIELLSNADLILTKNAILQKLKHFLEEVQISQQEILEKNSSLLPAEVLMVSPKISRGENYKGLPWLVLDYPRYFEKENAFAIRTMFWWGNFFSMTLHLSGRYKKKLEHNILKNISLSGHKDLYICVGNSEWEHHFHESNYQKLKTLSETEIKKIINEKEFLKIAFRSPIDSFSEIEKLLDKNYKLLVGLCI